MSKLIAVTSENDQQFLLSSDIPMSRVSSFKRPEAPIDQLNTKQFSLNLNQLVTDNEQNSNRTTPTPAPFLQHHHSIQANKHQEQKQSAIIQKKTSFKDQISSSNMYHQNSTPSMANKSTNKSVNLINMNTPNDSYLSKTTKPVTPQGQIIDMSMYYVPEENSGITKISIGSNAHENKLVLKPSGGRISSGPAPLLKSSLSSQYQQSPLAVTTPKGDLDTSVLVQYDNSLSARANAQTALEMVSEASRVYDMYCKNSKGTGTPSTHVNAQQIRQNLATHKNRQDSSTSPIKTMATRATAAKTNLVAHYKDAETQMESTFSDKTIAKIIPATPAPSKSVSTGIDPARIEHNNSTFLQLGNGSVPKRDPTYALLAIEGAPIETTMPPTPQCNFTLNNTNMPKDHSTDLISESNKQQQQKARRNTNLQCTKPMLVNITPAVNVETMIPNTIEPAVTNQVPAPVIENKTLTAIKANAIQDHTPILTNRLTKSFDQKLLAEQANQKEIDANNNVSQEENKSHLENSQTSQQSTKKISFYFEETKQPQRSKRVNQNQNQTVLHEQDEFECPTDYEQNEQLDLETEPENYVQQPNRNLEEVFYNGDKVWKATTDGTIIDCDIVTIDGKFRQPKTFIRQDHRQGEAPMDNPHQVVGQGSDHLDSRPTAKKNKNLHVKISLPEDRTVHRARNNRRCQNCCLFFLFALLISVAFGILIYFFALGFIKRMYDQVF